MNVDYRAAQRHNAHSVAKQRDITARILTELAVGISVVKKVAMRDLEMQEKETSVTEPMPRTSRHGMYNTTRMLCTVSSRGRGRYTARVANNTQRKMRNEAM